MNLNLNHNKHLKAFFAGTSYNSFSFYKLLDLARKK